jgi:hypothetical protein
MPASQLLDHQYRDASNLNARIALHTHYSTNHYGWFPWLYDQLDLTDQTTLLELGCGAGSLWTQNQDRLPSP